MYGLKEAEKYRVITIVDTNDADYLTRISIIEKEPLEKFLNFFTTELKTQKAYTGINFRYYPYENLIKDKAGRIEISGNIEISNKRYILMKICILLLLKI